MGISQSYASPGLRWGLILEDHPAVEVQFDVMDGEELGIPERLGGGAGQEFCVAHIIFPAETGRLPIIGYKSLDATPKGKADDFHESDVWNTLCTKALGRALKRAGYPDDTADLKMLILWRQRDAEIGAIRSGTAGLALPPAQIEKALDAAGKAQGHVGADDGIAEGVLVEDDEAEPPSAEDKDELRRAITALGARSSELNTWCRENNLSMVRPRTLADCRDVTAQALLMAGEAAFPAEPPSAPSEAPQEPPAAAEEPSGPDAGPDDDEDLPAQVAELVAGLDADAKRGFNAYAKTLGVPAKADLATLEPQTLRELLAWLAVD